MEAHALVKVVDVVSGSLSAAQLAKDHHPDLILIDSSIPVDEAVVLIRNLKTENPETRSIVITDTTQQRRKIIQSGADHTISAFNYEARIDEILNQLVGTYPEEPENTLKRNLRLSD